MSDAPPATSYTEPTRPDYAQARTALLAVIFLQIALNTHLSAGAGIFAHWLLPAAEAVLLLVLSSITTLGIRGLRRGSLSLDDYMQRHGGAPRVLAFTLIALITIANTVSLVRLVDALLHATKATGVALLDDAANLWITNLICFSLWYWELDRGGPARRGLPNERRPDFLFTNMTAPDFCESDWRPGFVDYLFLAFTNAAAFSPTDTLPLTGRAKAVMMLQAGASLLTIALVASRAVNILG
jgi:hypothetical protein